MEYIEIIKEMLPQLVTALVGLVSTGGLATIFSNFRKQQSNLNATLTAKINDNTFIKTLKEENEKQRQLINALLAENGKLQTNLSMQINDLVARIEAFEGRNRK